MTQSLFRHRSLLDIHREIESLIARSSYKDLVPRVPDTPVSEWGTIAWARFTLALLEARDG